MEIARDKGHVVGDAVREIVITVEGSFSKVRGVAFVACSRAPDEGADRFRGPETWNDQEFRKSLGMEDLPPRATIHLRAGTK